jgi:type IV pilus assembly protein PilE
MKSGFSLIELMIALTLIGIVSLISYPLYNQHLLKVHRVYMVATLLDVAGRMEKYHAKYNTYSGATVENLSVNSSRYDKYYVLDIKAEGDVYMLKAIPINVQEKDTACGMLSIDQNGNKSASGSENGERCWL